MAFVVAGERSGVGKTTVTLALLAYLSRRGDRIQSFKVGPDYIDPMFHTAITGYPCRNLDPILTSETYVKTCFTRHGQGVDYGVVEGVMGLFDGVNYQGLNDFASTAHIARLLNLPVLLVLDCSRLSGSVAAIAQGYCTFDSQVHVAGVILNKVGSERHLELLKNALEPLDIKIFGVLHRQDKITIPDRHLGLIPTTELPQWQEICDRLANLGETCFDWERLRPLLEPPHLSISPSPHHPISRSPRIAIARDQAFNFYYQDNLDLLEQLGAELVFWSPLKAERLPDHIQGLYFGGGFPEIFAQQLATNETIRNTVHQMIQQGCPTYAECGGLMYLCKSLVDFNQKTWSMVGVLPTTAMMGKHLTLGYRQVSVLQNSPFVYQGETLWGHEFHRSSLTFIPDVPLYSLRAFHPRNSHVQEGWQRYQLQASYVHLHWGNYPQIPARFVQGCEQFIPNPVGE